MNLEKSKEWIDELFTHFQKNSKEIKYPEELNKIEIEKSYFIEKTKDFFFNFKLNESFTEFLRSWEKMNDLEKLMYHLKIDTPLRAYYFDYILTNDNLKWIQRESLKNKDQIFQVFQIFDKMGIYEDLDPEFKKEKDSLVPTFFSKVVLPDDDIDHTDNLQFYQGKIPLKSDEETDFIDDIHKNWKGNYQLLEKHHGYIQWLFPNREQGTSPYSQPLTQFEAKEIKKLKEKILKSYELILDFFGIELLENGDLKRSKEYKERYENLNNFEHNYLRITRILRFLGIMGLEDYKLKLIKFFMIEIFKEGQIPNARASLIIFWIPTICKEIDLEKMENLYYEITKRKINKKSYYREDESWAYTFEKKVLTEEEIKLNQQKGKKLAQDTANQLKRRKKIENILTSYPNLKKEYEQYLMGRRELIFDNQLIEYSRYKLAQVPSIKTQCEKLNKNEIHFHILYKELQDDLFLEEYPILRKLREFLDNDCVRFPKLEPFVYEYHKPTPIVVKGVEKDLNVILVREKDMNFDTLYSCCLAGKIEGTIENCDHVIIHLKNCKIEWIKDLYQLLEMEIKI